jgi:hypothetical protein
LFSISASRTHSVARSMHSREWVFMAMPFGCQQNADCKWLIKS